jgi:peptidoglycan/xylan/chitin deacetylase (PgdA/CDA1 family)
MGFAVLRKSLSAPVGRFTSSVRRALQTPGQPLAAETRALLEPRFAHDFSRVRVHTSPEAAACADRLGAQAYTVGKAIVFATGRYAPDTPQGLGLLAHELVHTVQQGNAESLDPVPLAPEGGHAESNANALFRAAARREPLPPAAVLAPAVMRATRTFALTFDDGPHSAPLGTGINRTEKVLDTLKSKSVHAGFFIQTAAQDPQGHAMRGSTPVGRQLVQRMHSEGHEIGVHTGGIKDHELHTAAQKAGHLQSELQSAKAYIKGQTGAQPTLVRPPTGATNPDVLKTYQSVGLKNLLWDIDGDQGRNLPLPDLKQRMTNGIQSVASRNPPWKGETPSAPKIVVLHHDIQEGTANHIGDVIEHIKRETNQISKGADQAAFATP